MRPKATTCLLGLVLSLTAPAAQAEEIWAIEGATVYKDAKTRLEGATVLIRGGKIAAVGSAVNIPAEAKRIDARGMVVTAGLVDALTTLGLSEVSAVGDTNEGNFRGKSPIHAAYRVTDGYNPASVAIPIARTGGVTSVVSAPRGGLLSGSSAFFSLADGLDVSLLAVKTPLAMHATLGRDVLSSAEGSRGVALETLRELFDDTLQYQKRRDAFEKNQTRSFSASRLDLEALIPVVQGRLPLVVNVNRASDILTVVRLAKEYKLKVVIAGGAEAWRVASDLAQAKIPVLLDPTANLPFSFDSLYIREDAHKILVEAGVPVAISTLGSATDVRQLRQLAGIAVSQGLSWEDALRAITQTPLEIFGIEDRGTVEVGKVADLVLWSGDPLELSSRPVQVFCGGVSQSLETHQSLLLKRYKTLP